MRDPQRPEPSPATEAAPHGRTLGQERPAGHLGALLMGACRPLLGALVLGTDLRGLRRPQVGGDVDRDPDGRAIAIALSAIAIARLA